MGDYTELHFNAQLKTDVDSRVVGTLQYMLDSAIDPHQTYAHAYVHDHPLFLSARWRWMLCGSSTYFNAPTHSSLTKELPDSDQLTLSLQFSIKNYNQEIEKFLDWIAPYLDASQGEFLGYKREEGGVPTLIFFGHPRAQTEGVLMPCWTLKEGVHEPTAEPTERTDTDQG